MPSAPNNLPCITLLPGASSQEAVLAFSGDWTGNQVLPKPDELPLPAAVTHVGIDCTKLLQWDSLFLSYLLTLETLLRQRGISLVLTGLPEGPRRLMNLALAVPPKNGSTAVPHKNIAEKTGETVIRGWDTFMDICSFLGELVTALWAFSKGKARTRWADIWEQTAKASYQALPIISLIGFLIGVILAFIGAIPLRMFGAEIFISSLIGIGILRLMGPVMVGVTMAGRTGAAFSAELGTMNVNDEIDALRAMGVSPMDILILPRMLALCVIMPLLCLFADLLGILGGLFVGIFYSHLTQVEFTHQLLATTSLRDLFVGLFTSAVFGILIALCGCYQGIRCGRNSSAVGQATTASVVSSIVCMTIATAIITLLTVTLKI